MPVPSGDRSSLQRRVLEPERMDDPRLPAEDHRAALEGLARLNAVSGSVRHVWGPIRRLATRQRLSRLSVLDVATGGGDIPIGLAKAARRYGPALDLTGIDVSDQALDFAGKKAAAAGIDVKFRRCDVLCDPLPGEFDVVVCSLFLHHLTDDQARRALRTMAGAATRMLIVNDLSRSRLSLFQVWIATRLLSRSPVVHYDGPQSVRAAFTPHEARVLAEEAGLVGARTTHAFPCRFVLTWSRRDAEASIPVPIRLAAEAAQA